MAESSSRCLAAEILGTSATAVALISAGLVSASLVSVVGVFFSGSFSAIGESVGMRLEKWFSLKLMGMGQSEVDVRIDLPARGQGFKFAVQLPLIGQC